MRYIALSVPRTDMGFIIYHLCSHGLALFLMLPTTICAGMTLPIATAYLVKKGFGEKTVGSGHT